MTNPYAPPSAFPQGTSSPSPQIAPAPSPPSPVRTGRRVGWWAAAIAVVLVLVAGAAALGVGVGMKIADDRNVPAAAPSPPPAPTAEQVRAATVDLCTRFVAAYEPIPTPQKTGYDLLPAINYIVDALRDNPDAEGSIRSAVADDVRLMREHAAALTRRPPDGAIRPPPTPWKADDANAADQRVWDLCRGYHG